MCIWDKFFEQEELRWKSPHERVVALTPLLRARGFRSILDLGCGAGRHLVYLARGGYEVYGADISENGLRHARKWLDRERLPARLVRSDMSAIPFDDGSFETVICTHTIQHQTWRGMQQTMSEIRRVLRPTGLLFFTCPSRRDRRYGRGEELEPNTFIEAEGPDMGVPHHYSNLGEVEALLEGFVIRKIELLEQLEEHAHSYSHWKILGERE